MDLQIFIAASELEDRVPCLHPTPSCRMITLKTTGIEAASRTKQSLLASAATKARAEKAVVVETTGSESGQDHARISLRQFDLGCAGKIIAEENRHERSEMARLLACG